MTTSQNRSELQLPDLVEQYHAALYRYAYRLSGGAADAEDLTQQTYLAAHTNLQQVRDPGQVKSWLFTILRNCYLKSLRKGGDVVPLDCIAEPANGNAVESPIDPEQLELALAELSEEFRSPVILYYFEDFSYTEIAAQMGVPIGTVMSRLARAKKYLRRKLTTTAVPPTYAAMQEVKKT